MVRRAERDGFPGDPESVYLTSGASAGVSNILQLLIAAPTDGVLIPIPQYPLYTAALALCVRHCSDVPSDEADLRGRTRRNNAHPVEYFLDEGQAWQPQVDGLKEDVAKARASGVNPKAMVVISPGNPVGNCLSREAMESIVKFCHSERLVLMADEVYQTNIFEPSERPFISFRKVVLELGEPYASEVELVSFHSLSKGQTGECGRRGGYFELLNFDKDVTDQVYKLASIQLCPPLQGQIGIDVLVHPPQKGEPSYDKFKEETDAIQATLKQRSEILVDSFNDLEGVTCNKAQGALYLFPRLRVPKKAEEEAKRQGRKVDALYCMELLEKTGICVSRDSTVVVHRGLADPCRILRRRSCPGLGSARNPARCISGRPSSPRGRKSTPTGSRAFTTTSSGATPTRPPPNLDCL